MRNIVWMKKVRFYKKMRTSSLIILLVRKCLCASISRGKPSKYFFTEYWIIKHISSYIYMPRRCNHVAANQRVGVACPPCTLKDNKIDETTHMNITVKTSNKIRFAWMSNFGKYRCLKKCISADKIVCCGCALC